MQPDLNAMVVFGAVVKHGGFTAASRALSLPKSTISRKVAQLEADLGVRLLERTTRRLRVTEAGAEYVEYCERITAEAEQAMRAMTQLQDTPRGTLRVTTDHVFGTAFLPGLLDEYVKGYPDVDVQVVLSAERLDLITEGFDLAIWIGQLPDSTYIARLLGREQQILCASPAYVARKGSPKKPADLAQHDCLLFGVRPGSSEWRLVDEEGHTERVRVHGRIKASDVRVLYQAALDGVGVARLPSFMAAPELEAGRLVPVMDGWATEPMPLYVVYPSNSGQPAKVQTFVDLLLERLEVKPPSRAEPASSRMRLRSPSAVNDHPRSH